MLAYRKVTKPWPNCAAEKVKAGMDLRPNKAQLRRHFHDANLAFLSLEALAGRAQLRFTAWGRIKQGGFNVLFKTKY